MNTVDDKKIMRIAKTLDITFEEAKEMLIEDKEIDRMKDKDVTNDLSTEQKKTIKKYTNCTRGREGTKVDAYGKKTKKIVKDDDVKQMIINLIADSLKECESIADVNITNKQKYITFKLGADDFEIDLKRKRKKKE